VKPASFRIRLGISRCLLGDHVRYDGRHKRNPYLADVLCRDIDWVPVCPEVEAGLGTPREPMQLVGTVRRPRLLTITTRQDQTIILTEFSDCRIRELKSLNLSGYVFHEPGGGKEPYPLPCDRNELVKRSLVCTSSTPRSLRPCPWNRASRRTGVGG